MNRIKTTLITAALVLAVMPLVAQQQKRPAGGRVSPHETVSGVVDGNRVTLVYGRPYTKDPKTGEPRKIWGGLVPFGKVWRTGADEATLLITQKPIAFGETTVPAGAYTLYTLPNEDGTAKLIINKQIGQWGTQYDEKQDLARVDMQKGATEGQVDQFTMSVGRGASGGGVIKLMWENTQFTAAFSAGK